MTALLRTKLFAVCPHCGDGEFHIDHLLEPGRIGASCGPWFCDECGRGVRITARSATDVDIVSDESSMPRTLNLLTIPARDHPIYLVVHGLRSVSEAPGVGQDYFYGEHTCPTNWTGNIEAIIEDGDDDPHGVATFVRAIDRPTLSPEETEYDLRSLFPEAFAIEGGKIIDAADVTTKRLA